MLYYHSVTYIPYKKIKKFLTYHFEQVLRLEGMSNNTNGFACRIPKSISYFEVGKPIKAKLIQFCTWTDWKD